MSLPKEKIYLGYENSCEFQDICRLYPPLVGDIVKIGYDEFRYYRSLLTTSRDEIADLCVKQHIEEIPTPLQYLIILAQNEDILKIIEKAFQFFIHDKVYILDNYIVIGNILEKHLLTEQNFEDFQNCIRELIGDKPLEKENADMDPRLARMKAKQRERDRIKAKQSQSKVNYEFSTLMLATCCLLRNRGLELYYHAFVVIAAFAAAFAVWMAGAGSRYDGLSLDYTAVRELHDDNVDEAGYIRVFSAASDSYSLQLPDSYEIYPIVHVAGDDFADTILSDGRTGAQGICIE